MTAAPLSLSVLVGSVGFVTWYPSHTSDSAVLLHLYVLVGRVVVDPWSLSHTPTLLSLFVLVERYGVVISPPSRTPNFAVVPVLLAKANSLRGFQLECPL